MNGNLPERQGTAHVSIVPYQAFETTNGYVMVCAGNDDQYRRLCQALGRDDLMEDERFQTNESRVKYREILVPMLEEEFSRLSSEDCVEKLDEFKVSSGIINDIKGAFNDPQVIERDMIQEIEHPITGMIRMMGVPVKFSETKESIRLPPPLLGEHTKEILQTELNRSEEEIMKLSEDKVIQLCTKKPTQKETP